MDDDPRTLHERQTLFAVLVATLIQQATTLGFDLTLGEAYRTPEQAALDAQAGTGIADSLHCQRLAIDINLFRDGTYLTDTSAYQPLGDWWLQQDPLCRWGGYFHDRKDGNHFSVSYEGRA